MDINLFEIQSVVHTGHILLEKWTQIWSLKWRILLNVYCFTYTLQIILSEVSQAAFNIFRVSVYSWYGKFNSGNFNCPRLSPSQQVEISCHYKKHLSCVKMHHWRWLIHIEWFSLKFLASQQLLFMRFKDKICAKWELPSPNRCRESHHAASCQNSPEKEKKIAVTNICLSS